MNRMKSHSPTLHRRTAGLLAVLLLPLAALLTTSSGLDTAGPCSGTWWVQPAELRAGEPLPEFGFSTCDGEDKTTADYQGQPLLINFWATWCPPCRRELPGLSDLHEELGDEVALLGVSVDDDPARVRGFLKDHPLPYTQVWDSDGIALDLGLTSIPVTLAVDADGNLAAVHRGYADEDELKQLVERAQRSVAKPQDKNADNTSDAAGGGESSRDGLEVEASE